MLRVVRIASITLIVAIAVAPAIFMLVAAADDMWTFLSIVVQHP